MAHTHGLCDYQYGQSEEALKMSTKADFAEYLSLFDEFIGRDTSTDEDWIWHVLLVYTSIEQHEGIRREARALLSCARDNDHLLSRYRALGGRVGVTDAQRARRFLVTTEKLAPHAAAIKARALSSPDDTWTKTPRPSIP
jgi:hypothetical protein